jgi:hypothetical protein
MKSNNSLLVGPLELKKQKKSLRLKYKIYNDIDDKKYTEIMRFMAKIDVYEYVSLVKPNNKGKSEYNIGE